MNGGIPAVALIDSLERFKEDWRATICPNCQKIKWANSPFCRLAR